MAVLKSLNVKLNFAIAVVLVLVMGLSAYFTLQERQSEAIANTKTKAQLLTTTVSNIIRRDMESNHEKDMGKLIGVVSEFRDIETFRIFNTEGIILHSAEPGEVFNSIDDLVLDVFQSGNHSAPFRAEGGGSLSFCRVEVMQNEPACYRCHGSDTDIVGVLEVCMSMAEADELLIASRDYLILSTLGTILIVALAVSIVTTLMIKRPISALEKTMGRAQQGRLDVRAEARSNDELGRLGRSFNNMITRLDESNIEIQRLHHEQMKRSERLASIGEMAASVAHEIKNPLAGLSGAAHILSKSFSEEDPRIHAAEEMIKLTGRLDKTINDLLSFARELNPDWHQSNPNDVIDETLFFIDKDSKDDERRVEKDLDALVPEIETDEQLLQQILYNLIINARQACADKVGACVRVSSSRLPTIRMPGEYVQAEYVEIKVADSGPGIPAETMSNIFKPFFTTKIKGTGLGLSICSNIVDALGGVIYVDTTVGQGSTFYIWLKRERTTT